MDVSLLISPRPVPSLRVLVYNDSLRLQMQALVIQIRASKFRFPDPSSKKKL